MTTCDMCGGYNEPLLPYALQLVSANYSQAVGYMDMCEKCRKRLCEQLSLCVRSCRVSKVSDAIRGLTPEQVQQVEAYIAQVEAKREIPS